MCRGWVHPNQGMERPLYATPNAGTKKQGMRGRFGYRTKGARGMLPLEVPRAHVDQEAGAHNSHSEPLTPVPARCLPARQGQAQLKEVSKGRASCYIAASPPGTRVQLEQHRDTPKGKQHGFESRFATNHLGMLGGAPRQTSQTEVMNVENAQHRA